MRSAVKRGKKFIICAVAVLLAAIAACVAVSFTYASFREQAESEGGADVAGAVAEYVRGTATNSGEPIKYEISESGGIVFSNLQPGDILTYNFSIDGFKEIEEGVYAYNEVLLRITLEFSFTYAYPVGASQGTDSGRSSVAQEYLSAMNDGNVQFYHDNVSSDNLITVRERKVDDDVVYYDSGAESSLWTVTEDAVYDYDANNNRVLTGRNQKFGFYMYPQAEGEEDFSQPLAFRVSVPSSSGTGAGDVAEEFRLSITLNMTAEQILNTDSSTTG